MRDIAARLEQEHPENRFKSIAVTPMLDKLTSRARTTLWLLFGTVIGVMLIACVNVAHLQLARAAARGREMAVRSAIGAGPGRLTRQVLTENVVLGFAGCLVGLMFGWFTLKAFLAMAPADIPRLNEVHIDGRVLLFTLVVTTLCSLLFGVGPARRAARAMCLPGCGSRPREARARSGAARAFGAGDGRSRAVARAAGGVRAAAAIVRAFEPGRSRLHHRASARDHDLVPRPVRPAGPKPQASIAI